jgi:RHS repeat-associated protein
LKYQDSGNPSSYFNGNIWQTGWRNSGDIAKNYIFSYDGINRLESAVYSDGAANGHFNTAYTYDANGNISTLSRKANNVEIDALTYTYLNDGNRLYAVADNGTSAGYPIVAGGNYYQYDLNGNMTDDPSVGTSLSVDYNYLNLPKTVTFDLVDYVRYTYDAAGNKLVKAIDLDGNPNIGRFDYSGNFLYENGELKAIFTSAGRIIPFDNGGNIVYKFEYNLQDHLGNTRAVFSGHSNGQPELMQVTDYYPFGLVMNQESYFASGVLPNKYLYNNKELQDDELAGNSLGWYDYGARFYDPELGRWHSLDPLTEKYNFASPYNYVLNNPLIFIDPDGRDVDLSKLYQRNDDDELIYKRQVLAFELFAATKAGQSYLKDRAQEGFEFKAEFISDASFTAESAGQLSGKIDVIFGVADLSEGIGAHGKAPAKMLENGKLSLSFLMDDGVPNAFDFQSEAGGMRILKNVDTWHHEVFIHGEAHENRFNAGDYKGIVGVVKSQSYEHGSPYLRNKSSYYKGYQTYYNLVKIRDKYNLQINNNTIWDKIIFHGYNSW